MKKSLNLLDLLVLNAWWVGLSFKWNGLHALLLPAMLQRMVPEELKNTYLGLLTFFGLVLAMVLQPLSGALSDRWRSPWGRRRPLAVLGTAFDLVFLAVLAAAGGLLGVALGYIALQISSNLAHGPMQGLLPDQTPRQQIGQASGFKNFMDMFGLILASLVLGRTIDPQAEHPWFPIALIMGVVAVSGAITFLGVREQPSDRESPEEEVPPQGWVPLLSQPLQDLRRLDWRAHRPFLRLMAARFFFLLAVYGVQVFAQYYLRDALGVANPVKTTGDLLAAITLALVAFAVLGGWVGDRWGHSRVAWVASGLGALGCLLLLLARTPQEVLLYGVVLGMGIGLFLTANWALLNASAPPAEAGLFMGLTNLATAGSGAAGRLQGPLIDALNALRPGAWWGYSALFLLGALFILISALLLLERPPAKTAEQ